MTRIHIVVDSCAQFVNAHFTQQHGITVVPNQIIINGQSFREGIDLTHEEALELMRGDIKTVEVRPPSSADYAAVFGRLAGRYDAIISIHASREILKSWENARVAAEQFAGNCDIFVVNSQSICVAEGMLAVVGVKAMQADLPLDEIVRQIRGTVDRVYTMFYVERMDFLYRNQIFSPAHSILGTMLGVKPFLTIEDGIIVPIEKVKTRAQAIDRMVEFAIEFEDIEQTAVIQPKLHPTEQTRQLQDRLASEFPRLPFAHTVYTASLGAFIGPEATGIVILEEDLMI